MKSKKLMLAVLALAACVAAGAAPIAATAGAEGPVTADPSFNLIAGGQGDMAYFNADGTVSLDVTPTPGFGFRANAANLGEANLLDVKKFTTTIEFTSVPVNVTMIFGLQTVPTGTIGGGNGNALNLMFRRDAENIVAVAIYDAAASEPAYWAPGQLALGADKTVAISYDYESATPVTIRLADTYQLPESIVSRTAFDTHYAASGYRGYYSLSSYYFTPPASQTASYKIKEINGKTPLENYRTALDGAVAKYEAAVNALTEESTADEIRAVGELGSFGPEDAYGVLLGLCDGDGAFAARLSAAQSAYDVKAQKILFEEIDAQITVFANLLETLDTTDAEAVATAIAAYEAIDRETMNGLGAQWRERLEESLSAITTGKTFKKIIADKTESYVASYEAKMAMGDAASLATYKDLNAIVENWGSYKAENYITVSLTADEIASFDARITAIGKKMESSFYASLWTEGDTWNAMKTDKGLYATGEGKYYETLGFNQKLQLGKNATIEFNIIYALRKLGVNHLHVGFYPVSNTGTKGGSDGVRVDFWFSDAGMIEIKPVNGRTETAIFEGAYLSVEDEGFFDLDADALDYSQGKYTVTLSEDNGVLVLAVNGLEMELTGLSPDLYKDGCYMTLSTMSVAGASWNELLVTKVGDVSYIKSEKPDEPDTPSSSEDSDASAGSSSDKTPGGKGCGSVIGFGAAGAGVIAAAVILCRRRKKNGNDKNE